MSYSIFPTIDLEATGRNILMLRKKHGYSVRDLAEYFCFDTPQAIYKWQWGQCLPSVDNLFALSKLFNTSINDILVETNQDVGVFWGTFLRFWFLNQRFNDKLIALMYTIRQDEDEYF